ncbi:hypothetical protein [Nibricoccus aquaticus]|nr:hypothetical protein [Nibricoccus aquaticus]
MSDAKLTPMMQQYFEVKSKQCDLIGHVFGLQRHSEEKLGRLPSR